MWGEKTVYLHKLTVKSIGQQFMFSCNMKPAVFGINVVLVGK